MKPDVQTEDYSLVYAGVGLVVLGFTLVFFKGFVVGFVVALHGLLLLCGHELTKPRP